MNSPLRPAAPCMPPVPPRISSQQLLGPHREVQIVHGGEVYRLRHTSQGKLILTK